MRENFVSFRPPRRIQKDLLLYSDGLGFESDPDFDYAQPFFNNYLILYTICGTLICEQDGNRVEVQAGQAVLMDPHRPYRHYFKKDTPTRMAWCHLNGAAAVPIVERITALHPLPFVTEGAAIYEGLLHLFEISDNDEPDVFAQSGICYGLLMQFLSAAVDAGTPVTLSPQLQFFKRRCWQNISLQLGTPITLDSLAAQMSMSKYHFARTFRKVFGMTLIEFITAERLRQAEYRLQTTSRPVCTIAEELGFNDAGYFTKVFKKAYGVTPSAFRRQNGSPCREEIK